MVTLKNKFLISLRNALLELVLKSQTIQKALLANIGELTIKYLPNSNIINNGERAPDTVIYDQHKAPIQLRTLLRGSKYKVLIFAGEQPVIAEIDKFTLYQTDLFELIIISPNVINNKKVYLDETLLAHMTYHLKAGGMCVVRPDQYVCYKNTTINAEILQHWSLTR